MKIINLKTLIFLKYKSRIWNLISNMVLTFTIKLRLKEICFFYFKYFQKKTKTNLYLIIIKYGIFKDIKRIITMFKQCSWLRLTLSLSVCFFSGGEWKSWARVRGSNIPCHLVYVHGDRHWCDDWEIIGRGEK